MVNQRQLEAAIEQVREQLSMDDFKGIRHPQKLPLHIFETLASTNQTLWELLNQGATTGTVVIAAQQTAGRGQWGRQWQSTRGGLYLSVALAPNLPASNSAQLTMCSAWGIATALRVYNIPVFLKWPNDLMLLGRKLGGILTETRVQQGQITKAVVGVGINWSNCVPETGINLQAFLKSVTPEKVSSYQAYGSDFYQSMGTGNPTGCNQQPLVPSNCLLNSVTSLEMLAAIILEGLNFGYQRWSEQGIETFLPSYLQLLEALGKQVIVDGNPGIITGVTSTGELRVCLNSLNSKQTTVGSAIASTSSTEICIKPGTISLGYRR